MATWPVSFEKEFELYVEAPSRAAAQAAADAMVESGELDSASWETGEWVGCAYPNHVKRAADHAIVDGMIVNIEDVLHAK